MVQIFVARPPKFAWRREGGRRVVGDVRPDAVLVVAGLLVGVLAVVYRLAADRPAEYVLFSGQAQLPELVAEGWTRGKRSHAEAEVREAINARETLRACAGVG